MGSLNARGARGTCRVPCFMLSGRECDVHRFLARIIQKSKTKCHFCVKNIYFLRNFQKLHVENVNCRKEYNYVKFIARVSCVCSKSFKLASFLLILCLFLTQLLYSVHSVDSSINFPPLL